ncbi:MAG: sodium:panthothenate symporter [Kiritimatiellae bacterium]|nr:sodium:panthothenate symporter [Kiritimatiellia bacterium]
MHAIDWILVVVPLVFVVWVGLRTQRYVKGVADFLTAGRVAGRYVLSVSSGEAGMGLISLVAVYESYYQSGFAYGFWGSLAAPISIILGLTGYCTYRFRETRAMTVGQFLEIRYSRRFRNFAGVLQSTSGILNFALFPAVGARFVVYFCGLPVETVFAGMVFPTFALVMAFFLSLEAFVAIKGGQITTMVTNCVQGLLSYPLYLVIVLFVLLNFSWFRDMAPAILDRPPGKSLINPFDITALRDFNLLYVIIGILSSIINRMGWSGNLGYSVSAKNAHEQKMAGVLGSWRSGFENMMFLLLAIVGLTYLNSDKYQGGPRGAVACRTELAIKAVNDVAAGEQFAPVRVEIVGYLQTGVVTPEMQALLDKTAAIKVREEAEKARLRYVGREEGDSGAAVAAPPNAAEEKQAAREARVDKAKNAIRAVDPGAAQTYGTIFGQMRVPMALRFIMPIGIIGIFAFLCIFQMVTCDSSYMLSWGSILVQDVILPYRKKPFTPKQQLLLLRILIASVATFAFFFSYFFGQVDYILMFFAITGAIWLGGSGPCIVGGLYWKRGTTAGAWVALIGGSILAVAAILVQKLWVPNIYPWLHAHGMVESLAVWLERCSAPFEPIIRWRMSSDKYPINSQEVYGITMLISIGLYVVVSLLTSTRGRVFNMDRMLHRGQYHREGIRSEKPRLAWRTLYAYLLGIDNQYTRGDRILAWSVFVWSFGWGFLCCFVGVAIWNFVSPWGNVGWSRWFFLNNFILAGAIATVSTVWFMIGGVRNLRRLFRDLKHKDTNVLDDGRVVGHVSADDVPLVEQVEKDEG